MSTITPSITISFKPKQVTRSLLSPLSPRAREVIMGRFGLGTESSRRTLDAIGQDYGITRERVRQIENVALIAIKKSDAYKNARPVFDELHGHLDGLGGIVAEEDFLSLAARDEGSQNHIHFYLVLGDQFNKHKEDDHFESRWSVDHKQSARVHDALLSLHEEVDMNDLIPESEIIARFLARVEAPAHHKNPDTARRWLSISKVLGKNALGDWGRMESPNISARGIRDYAFLVIRKHGSPMHFTEVAKAITNTFGKKAHVATCHNELIKDSRFVLVGRGLYVLSEWGYMGGVVRDVITDLLKSEGPMTREEIVDRVMKERYVKENTIVVNLQNGKHFAKDKKGRYSAA
ncbi:HTH domain-containing protein [bacterium]|nr:HTH domain-containing protein [bacterium]